MSALLAQVKESKQDFEWYPTSDEMIEAVKKSAFKFNSYNHSILDIGAGDGRVLRAFNCKKYAIEKSSVLLQSHDKNITPLGMDFHTMSLIDKQADVIFCNPPYSEYEQWMIKIINEANCREIYFVVPRRWKDSKGIKRALENRKLQEAHIKTIFDGDFLNAERQARAKIEIIKINMTRAKDNFSAWLDLTFEKEEVTTKEPVQELSEKVENQLVTGRNVIDVLVQLYEAEQEKLQDNYTAIMGIDSSLLKAIDIDRGKITEFIKKSIKDLKHKYWKELFESYKPITKKLTSSTLKELVGSITSNTSVDFTHENTYMITAWVLKKTSSYYDRQILDTFKALARDETIKEFKSNQKFFDNEEMGYNRYRPKTESRYYLLNRIIVDNWHNFEGYSSWTGHLTESTFNTINDLIIVSRLLGYSDLETMPHGKDIFEAGKPVDFYSKYKGKRVLLMSVKLFLKGTMHIKFHPEYITKINILHGKINGWVKSKEEAAEQMNIKPELVAEVYDKPLMQLSTNNLLLGAPIEKEDAPEALKKKPKVKKIPTETPNIEDLKKEFSLAT